MNETIEEKELKKRQRKVAQAKKNIEKVAKFWSDVMTTNEKSRAHSLLCERVYGKDLSQSGMMNMEQLVKLLDVLELSSKNRVIDLGCGTGRITEFISDITGARVLGIDALSGAIHSALERTREKRERIDFKEGNFYDLSLDPACADTIIAIDSLYSHGLSHEQLITQLKVLLTRGGQMGIFYSKHCDPRRKKLDQALNNLNLSFQTWHFTDSEHEVWLKQAQALKELEEDFMAEGNQAGYNVCKVDCDSWLPVLEEGKGRRYLYHVQLL